MYIVVYRVVVALPVPVAARSNAWVCDRLPAETIGSNSASVMDVCREFCLRDELITRPEESYRLWCVVVCDLEIKNEEAMAHVGSPAPRGGGG